jgi:selenophosphate synthetase-related protein
MVGDDIIFASDLDGYYPEKLDFAWDTTSKKDQEIVRKQMLIMNAIGRKRLAHAAKDISNPGSLGTLGMLLETSGKGGRVRIQDVPTPRGADFSQWIRSYQGCGFVLTCRRASTSALVEEFRSVGVEAAAVGTVDAGHKIVVDDGEEKGALFDFAKDIITGCGPGRVPCRK